MQQKRFSVLGWSDGGITALIVTGRYPELVHKLVVWGANAYILPTDMPIFEGEIASMAAFVDCRQNMSSHDCCNSLVFEGEIASMDALV